VALLSQIFAGACGRRMRRRLRIPLLLALLCASAAAAHAQTQVSEVSLKSAFLYKFIHYTDWPDEALGAVADPIAICVIEQDALAEALEGAVSGRVSHERPVIVRRIAGEGELGRCHVLFVGSLEPARLEKILSRASAQPTLTIGDADGFARRGGMINFTRRGSRLGFEINRGSVRRAGLNLSSQLLKLAELVPDESGGN
jgi:YfiR/HmsC-like